MIYRIESIYPSCREAIVIGSGSMLKSEVHLCVADLHRIVWYVMNILEGNWLMSAFYL